MATAFVSSHQFDDAAIRGTVKDAYHAAYRETKPLWENTLGFERMSTDSPFEEFTQFAGIGVAPPREEGQQVAIDVPKQGYTLRVNVVSRAIMIPVSDEALRFLKRGKMSVRNFIKPSEEVGRSMKVTNEILAADVYGNAFDATNFPGMDSASLVSTAHKLVKTGASASNSMGAVSLDQASIEAGLIQGDKMPDELGIPIGVQEGKRYLVIPPDYRFDAERILSSTQQSDNANNAINALSGAIDKTPRVNRYLPSTTNWFIRNSGEKQCLIALFETEPMMKDFGDDKTHVMYFEAYEMCAFTFGLNWRGIQGSSF